MVIDFLVRGVVRASRTMKSDTSDDASDFLGRSFIMGVFWMTDNKPRLKKWKGMRMHIPSDFLGRGF